MPINRKPDEQVEVDWAGNPAAIIDPDMKQRSWINAHIHMYEYFGGVTRILVPDNCKTAVVHNGGFKDQ